MRVTREDVAAARTQRRKQAAKERLPELRSIAQAAVAEARLTGSPEWDAFLRVVQAMRDEAAAAQESFTESLATGEYISADQLLSLKFHVERAAARVDALEDVMALPAQMREQGAKALALVQEIEGA